MYVGLALLADVKRQHEFCGGPISEDQMRVAVSAAIAMPCRQKVTK